MRQIAHRAREHLYARRKRSEPADAVTIAKITEHFMTAAATGDLAGLQSLSAQDVPLDRGQRRHGHDGAGRR